ncbi:MAG: O-antigen ligase family protein, partial [Cytophagales bacterium]
FLLACYGVVQEFKGLHPIEENWVRADEGRFALYYNWGKFRKFSFFSDPMTYGITCAYTSVLCLVLALGPRHWFWKGFYFFCTLLMTVAMVFSGTRTAFVLLPIGVAFLTILTLNRTFIAFSVLFFGLGAGIIFSPIKSLGPIDANALERIRSAFQPGDDPSFQVRIKNQAFIKPFILSHPIGAGLGSIGVWGQRFSPWTPIANFPPDSGFVRIAVELGWIGLILYSYMLFEVMRLGIRNYHLIRDPIIKNTQAALLSCMFTLIVANYAQEAITMYPTSVIFYTAMALTTLMPKFDRYEKKS